VHYGAWRGAWCAWDVVARGKRVAIILARAKYDVKDVDVRDVDVKDVDVNDIHITDGFFAKTKKLALDGTG